MERYYWRNTERFHCPCNPENEEKKMDAPTPVKQIITFQKTFFENTYEATCRLQDQTCEMNETFFTQMPFLPEEGKKIIAEFRDMAKKTRENFKKAIDDGFARLEELLQVK